MISPVISNTININYSQIIYLITPYGSLTCRLLAGSNLSASEVQAEHMFAISRSLMHMY